jgi:hypothetical protein
MAFRKRAYPHFAPLWGVIKAGSFGAGLFTVGTKESQKMKERPFWKTKSLHEMTRDEWESLCDSCGICCLEKVEDEETGEIKLTSVSCEFLDTVNCR